MAAMADFCGGFSKKRHRIAVAWRVWDGGAMAVVAVMVGCQIEKGKKTADRKKGCQTAKIKLKNPTLLRDKASSSSRKLLKPAGRRS